jgi:hypothetical protein
MQPPQQRLMPATQLAAKVREYEQFANDVLKVDLQKTTTARAKLQADIQELEELRTNIQHLQQQQQVCVRLGTSRLQHCRSSSVGLTLPSARLLRRRVSSR